MLTEHHNGMGEISTPLGLVVSDGAGLRQTDVRKDAIPVPVAQGLFQFADVMINPRLCIRQRRDRDRHRCACGGEAERPDQEVAPWCDQTGFGAHVSASIAALLVVLSLGFTAVLQFVAFAVASVLVVFVLDLAVVMPCPTT